MHSGNTYSISAHCISKFVIILMIVIAASVSRLRLRDFVLLMLRAENFGKCGIFDKKLTIFERKSLNRQAVYSIYEVFGGVTQAAWKK